MEAGEDPEPLKGSRGLRVFPTLRGATLWCGNQWGWWETFRRSETGGEHGQCLHCPLGPSESARDLGLNLYLLGPLTDMWVLSLRFAPPGPLPAERAPGLSPTSLHCQALFGFYLFIFAVVLLFLLWCCFLFIFYNIFFHFSNFILFFIVVVLLLFVCFLFFLVTLSGLWDLGSQSGGWAWAPVVGVLSPNGWTNKEPQILGNIN